MTVKQQWAVVVAVVALLAAGGFAATHFLGDELAGTKIGEPAPAFAASTLTSQPGEPAAVKTLASYRGDVVLLNIWATWCTPCRTEMPSIQALHEALGPKGLKVVAVSIDQPGSEKQIRDFLREYKLSFEVLNDSTGAIQTTYRTTGVPESFVIARDGTVRKIFIGADDWNSEGNRRLIMGLLDEARP